MALSQFSSSLNLLWVWYSCIQPLSPWNFLPSLPRGPCHLSILLIKACSSSPSTEDFNVAISVLQFAFGSRPFPGLWCQQQQTSPPDLTIIFFWRFPAGCFEVILKAAHMRSGIHPWCPDLSFFPVLTSGSPIFPGFYCHCLSSQPTSHMGSVRG